MVNIKLLIWDEWNIAHIARHNVLPEEVEEICFTDPLIQQGNKGRTMLVGSTKADRIIRVVLDPEQEEGVYYPVTAHTASKRDRRLYEKRKEVNKNDYKN